MFAISHLQVINFDIIFKGSDQFDCMKLSLVFILIWLSKANRRRMVVLEVEVETEGVSVDDTSVDEGLDECWIWTSSYFRE